METPAVILGSVQRRNANERKVLNRASEHSVAGCEPGFFLFPGACRKALSEGFFKAHIGHESRDNDDQDS